MFRKYLSRFFQGDAPALPAVILEQSLQTLKNHQYSIFNQNIPSAAAAFEQLAEKSPRKAVKLMISIERDRHQDKADNFFQAIAAQLPLLLQRCSPTIKREIYTDILDAPLKSDIRDFLIAQASDISQFMSGDLGARFTRKILEHSEGARQKVLEAYAPAFEKLLKSLSSPNYISKLLCKAYKDENLALPAYLETVRSGIVRKVTDSLVRCCGFENRDFKLISAELAQIIGLGFSETDRISEIKGHDGLGKETGLRLYHIRLITYSPEQPKSLYILCSGNKASFDTGRQTPLLVGYNIEAMKTAFGMMGRPASEQSDMTQIAAQVKDQPPAQIIVSSYYSYTHHGAAFSLHPAFSCVSELTDRTNRVDSPYGQRIPHRYDWDILPIQLHSDRKIQ